MTVSGFRPNTLLGDIFMLPDEEDPVAELEDEEVRADP